MPGKVRSKAQQAYLAIHKPKVLKELAGGQPIASNLPDRVRRDANAGLAGRLRKRY